MNFTLVVCTYMRPKPLTDLLESVNNQTRYPNEILIVDGSTNEDTKALFSSNSIKNLTYYLVDANHRGLTKQRNFGIEKVAKSSEVVCFLDDDTYLAPDYFEQLMQTYSDYPEALGVGGYISNESQWQPVSHDDTPSFHEFYYDGYKIQDSSRFILRKRLGLDSNLPPGFSPRYSHGRSIGFLPPSGKTYKVEQLMGGVASYKMELFANFKFSTFFEGYGLYEDACLYLESRK